MTELTLDQQRAIAMANARKRQAEAQQQSPTAGSRAEAGIGGLATGASYLAGLPMDTVRNIANLGLTGYGAIKNLLTGDNKSPTVLGEFPGGGESIKGVVQSAGIPTENPNPNDPASRMLHMAGTIGGGSLIPGSGVKSTLAAVTGGALASEIDPGNPLVAMAGAMTPGATAGGFNAARRAMSTGQAANNASLFSSLGSKPSAGLVTESSFLNGLENIIAKFPGGQKRIANARQKLQEDIGRNASTGVSAEDAGRAIERGIKGDNGFLATTKAQWEALDNKMAAKLKGTTLAPSATIQALDELTSPIQGALKTTGSLVTPKLAKMKEDLAEDLTQNGGQLPFEALRALRTRVGAMVEDSLVSDVPGGEAKRLYKALSEDLKSAANANGAKAEFARQQNFYKARMDRIDSVLEKVIGRNKNPEDIFKTFYPKDPSSVSTVRATIRSLPKAERRIVANAVVDRLGRASPGKQNEYGDVFSSETFLTNWNKMSDGAKSVLFPDPKMRMNLDFIASASSKIRTGESVFKNPSGTTGQLAAMTVYGSPLLLLTGNVGAFAGAVSMAGASALTARLLTNPRFINWLAKAPKGNPDALAAHVARLSTIYNASDDATKEDLKNYAEAIGSQ